ncbi:hypothetical protein DBV15_05088 [Temnothorax longispinosus]|uniref:Uncharacterized protein n=1 Tax=Temnothorax longispinosus TaxID=300112 RepID=A0A4S2KYE9_9HYME|nr:hypothetical protein DBV15_05088 [Temnothorax longispinosus]
MVPRFKSEASERTQMTRVCRESDASHSFAPRRRIRRDQAGLIKSIERLAPVLSREDSIARLVQRAYFYRANLGYCLREERTSTTTTTTTTHPPSLTLSLSRCSSPVFLANASSGFSSL